MMKVGSENAGQALAAKLVSPQGAPNAGIVNAVVVASVLTFLNALKPLHIDDVIWFYFAGHIANHPGAPFAFTIPWSQISQPAMNVMAPPVVPYWWAGAMKLFGDHPFLWKASLLPINLALAFSVRSLANRFAPSIASAMVWLTLISPTILPSENLMLDVPCLSLTLSGLAVYLDACDRDSWRRAVIASLLFGLALLTKWSAFTGIGVFVVATLLFARSRRWLLGAPLALALFVAWEVFIRVSAGESHFLHHNRVDNPLHSPARMVVPLWMILGGVAPVASLLAAVGLAWRPRTVIVLMGVFAAGFGVVALLPSGTVANATVNQTWRPRVDTPVFLLFGAIICGTILALVWREWRDPPDPTPSARSDVQGRRIPLFLLAWVVIELGGYFALSPFPAVRRVLGLTVALTFLAAHAAVRVDGRRWIVWAIASFGVGLGLLYFTVDFAEALAGKRAAEQAGAWIRARAVDRPIWFSGPYGFELYATRDGMKPVFPGHSLLRAGDWLAINTRSADPVEGQTRYPIDQTKLKLEQRLDIQDPIPLTTVICYYLGRRSLEHQSGPRFSVLIYRVGSDFEPIERSAPKAPE